MAGGLDVVLRDGLTGRHSHVFDLVSVGVRRAKEIATAGGMGYDTARGALAKLVDAGMLDRQAVELGGMEKRAKLAERIREERARPRGDSIRLAPGDVLDIDENVYDDDLRRWHEEELLRQLGLI